MQKFLRISTIFLFFIIFINSAYAERYPLENENPYYNIFIPFLNVSHTINGTLKSGINVSFYNLNVSKNIIVIGNLNATQINSSLITIGNNMVVTEEAIFNKANYSIEYDSTGYKLVNFTSNYDARLDRYSITNYSAEYATSGFKRENISEYLGGTDINSSVIKEGNLSTILVDGRITNDLTIQTSSSLTVGGGFESGGLTLETDGDIWINNIYMRYGNISTINVTDININGSLNPTLDNLFDIGSKNLRWLNGNFTGTLEVNSITSPTIRLTNLQDLDESNFFDLTGCGTSTTFTALDSTGAITCSSISITESQISNLKDYIVVGTFDLRNISNYTHYINQKDFNIGNISNRTDFINVLNHPASSNFQLSNVSNNTPFSSIQNMPLFSNFQLSNVSNNTLLKGDNATIALWTVEWNNIARVSGNVGIGTSNPAYKLTVAGNTNISGARFISNSFINFTNNTAFNETLYLFDGKVGIGTQFPSSDIDLKKTKTGGDLIMRVSNDATTGDASTSYLVMRIGGISGGDPFILFDYGAAQGWMWGVDNSDSSKMKLSWSSTWRPGNGDIISVATNGNVNIGTLTTNNLTVNGNIKANGFINFTNNTVLNETLYLVNGDVGIGANVPNAKLDVRGIINTNTYFRLRDSSDVSTSGLILRAGTLGVVSPPSVEDVFIHSEYGTGFTSGGNAVAYIYITSTGNVGIRTMAPTAGIEFDVEGQGECDGAGCWTVESDISKKENITNMTKYSLSDIIKIQPREYNYKRIENDSLSGNHSFGFIAQELKLIVPEIVYGEEGSMSIGYGGLTPILVKAIQEQQKEINLLKSELCKKDSSYSWC